MVVTLLHLVSLLLEAINAGLSLTSNNRVIVYQLMSIALKFWGGGVESGVTGGRGHCEMHKPGTDL